MGFCWWGRVQKVFAFAEFPSSPGLYTAKKFSCVGEELCVLEVKEVKVKVKVKSLSCVRLSAMHALLTWLSCTDDVADHALIMWLPCTANVADHAMIT